MGDKARKLTIRMPEARLLRQAYVSDVLVDLGEQVSARAAVLALRVGRAHHTVRAPRSGRVITLVAREDPVAVGDPLFILYLDDTGGTESTRALVPADQPRWSDGVTPDLIVPIARERPPRRSPLARFLGAWGRPVAAVLLYVLACFTLLPLLHLFGAVGPAWAVAAMCAAALGLGAIFFTFHGPKAGSGPRWTVRLVAASWLGLAALAVFGRPDVAQSPSHTDAPASPTALIAPEPRRQPSPASGLALSPMPDPDWGGEIAVTGPDEVLALRARPLAPSPPLGVTAVGVPQRRDVRQMDLSAERRGGESGWMQTHTAEPEARAALAQPAPGGVPLDQPGGLVQGQTGPAPAPETRPDVADMRVVALGPPDLPHPMVVRDLLFLYVEDPRVRVHPGPGDDWFADVSPELSRMIEDSRVVSVRDLVRVSSWCPAAGGAAPDTDGFRQAWLDDRLRLLQVRVHLAPGGVTLLENELPVFGGQQPGFFHNRLPLMGADPTVDLLARGTAYIRTISNRFMDPNTPAALSGGHYFDTVEDLTSALGQAGCRDVAWHGGDGPVTALGQTVAARLGR